MLCYNEENISDVFDRLLYSLEPFASPHKEHKGSGFLLADNGWLVYIRVTFFVHCLRCSLFKLLLLIVRVHPGNILCLLFQMFFNKIHLSSLHKRLVFYEVNNKVQYIKISMYMHNK